MNTEDFITIETHFGVTENFIRANTRNKCSDDLVAIMREIAEILYPNEDFDIYLLPAEPGSYKDIARLIKRYKIGSLVGTAVVVGGLAVSYLNYRDSHETHIHEMKIQAVDDTAKCLELKKTLEDLQKDYEISNVPEEKISEVCGNLNIKKRKNSFYNTLGGDGMVKNNEVVLKDMKSQSVISKKIERTEFVKYIEPIPDQKFVRDDIEGVVEVISPVLKQKKEGRGIEWRGAYYGEDVSYNGISILKNEEDVDFYMQDSEFKSKISDKEVTFAQGDNMRIAFSITGELKAGMLLNRSIYIKEVKSYNEEIIPHKIKNTKNSENIATGQKSLFK